MASSGKLLTCQSESKFSGHLGKANSDKQPSFKTVTLLAEAIQIGLYIASHITALPLATFLEDLATSVTRSKCLGTAFFFAVTLGVQSPLE